MKDHEHEHGHGGGHGAPHSHEQTTAGGHNPTHSHVSHEKNHGPHPENQDSHPLLLSLFVLAALSVAVMAFNQIQIADVQYAMTKYSAAGVAPAAGSGQSAPAGSSANLQALADRIIPKGIPAIYGKELGVSYDDPVAAMTVLSPLDDGTQLSAEQNARYTKIVLQISCEYCCGAESIIFANGQAACGCQHSYVMRGLAKYLITKHGTEYSDEQVLEELGKWKTLFFPKQILTKAMQFEAAGKAINTIDLTSNKYRGFTASAAGQSGSAQGVANLPNMVGGC